MSYTFLVTIWMCDESVWRWSQIWVETCSNYQMKPMWAVRLVYFYCLCHVELQSWQSLEVVRHLDVLIDRKLTWEYHYVNDIAKRTLTQYCMFLSGGTRTGIIPFVYAFIARSCIHVWSMTVLSAPLLITVSRKYWPQFFVNANVSLTEPCERNTSKVYIYIYTGLSNPCHAAQGHETERYIDGSHGLWNQEWLCWRGPAAIYPTKQPVLLYVDVFSGNRMAQFLVRSQNIQL
jgi:hypothetical protein